MSHNVPVFTLKMMRVGPPDEENGYDARKRAKEKEQSNFLLFLSFLFLLETVEGFNWGYTSNMFVG